MKIQNSYLFHLTHDFLEFRLPVFINFTLKFLNFMSKKELEMVCDNIKKPNCISNHNYSNDVIDKYLKYMF